MLCSCGWQEACTWQKASDSQAQLDSDVIVQIPAETAACTCDFRATACAESAGETPLWKALVQGPPPRKPPEQQPLDVDPPLWEELWEREPTSTAILAAQPVDAQERQEQDFGAEQPERMPRRCRDSSRAMWAISLPLKPVAASPTRSSELPFAFRIALWPILVVMLDVVMGVELFINLIKFSILLAKIAANNRGSARLPALCTMLVLCSIVVFDYSPWAAISCKLQCDGIWHYAPWVGLLFIWLPLAAYWSCIPTQGISCLLCCDMPVSRILVERAPSPAGRAAQILGEVRASLRVPEATGLPRKASGLAVRNLDAEMFFQLVVNIGGRIDLLNKLLSDGLSVDANFGGTFPLLIAFAMVAEPGAALRLISEGANLNATDAYCGLTALHWACRWDLGIAMRRLDLWFFVCLKASFRADRTKKHRHDVLIALLDNPSVDPCKLGVFSGLTPYGFATDPIDIEILRPKVPWTEIEVALLGCAQGTQAQALIALVPSGREATALRLPDLLFCRHEGCSRELAQRRRILWDAILLPMVQEAAVRPLSVKEKKLMTYVWEASRGPPKLRAVARASYRAEMQAVVQATMDSFAAELQIVRDRLLASPDGRELCAQPPVEMMVAPEELRHDRFLDCSSLGWALDRDFPAAVRELRRVGILDTAGSLTRLVRDGAHPLVGPTPRMDVLGSPAEPAVFWRSLVALWLTAVHHKAKSAFDVALLDCVPAERLHTAPVKGFPRIMEKAAEYIDERNLRSWEDRVFAPLHVVDQLRATVESDSAAEQFAAERALLRTLPLVRAKHGHHPNATVAGGYRDTKLNFLFQHDASDVDGLDLPIAVIVEVQLVLSSYASVKSKMHSVYRVHRGDFGER